jgi:DNA-binding beta-propeller fold protein YncE
MGMSVMTSWTKRALPAVAYGLCMNLCAAHSTVHAQTLYDKSVLVPGLPGTTPGTSPHALSGMNFGKDGKLYVASVVGAGIHRVDVKARTIEQIVFGPTGESDDVAMAPDGTLVWGAIIAGEVRARRPDGTIETLATDLPMVNPVNFTANGKLIVGQVTKPDTLVEIDLAKKTAPRILGTDLGRINAFDHDGKAGLYVPLLEKGAIGHFDLATRTMRVIAEDLGEPVAVKRDSNGNLFTIDWQVGKIFFVNPESGETMKLATVTPPLDNIAIAPDDTIYVSRPTDNSIIEVDHETGAQRAVLQGSFSAPAGLAVTERNGKPALLVADPFGYRFTDPATGRTELLPFDIAARGSSAVAVNDKLIVTANVRNGSVVVIDKASGRVLHTIRNLKDPMGVALSKLGEIYVSEYASGNIVKLTPGGTPEQASIVVDLDGPVGLAIDSAGRLIASENRAGQITRVDLTTGAKETVARNLVQPEGFALLPHGDIVVAEVGAKRLTVIGKTGAASVVASDLPLGTYISRAPAPVFLPTGVAVDTTGTIYVTADADNSVLKFTPRKTH